MNDVCEELEITWEYVRWGKKNRIKIICRAESQLCNQHGQLGIKNWRKYTKILIVG